MGLIGFLDCAILPKLGVLMMICFLFYMIRSISCFLKSLSLCACFLVGQSICLVLKCLNETKYYDDMPFENYVKETCNLVNSAIPNLGDEEDDIPSSLIAFYTLAILVYGDLIKGITFPIIPMVKAKGYILDVKTSQEGIEITENGRSFLSKANAGNCLFTGKISNQDDLFDGIYKNLAIDYMQKVAEKFQDQ